MTATSKAPAEPGFVRTFVLPGLSIFLIPVLSLLFFRHAQDQFDGLARESLFQAIQNDRALSPEEREKALAFFRENSVSALLDDPEAAEFASGFDKGVLFDFATFRWMIRLSFWSILGSVAVLLLAGFCVWISQWSQAVQYRSLVVGWQVLRLYAALQTIVQGILIVALSYWVTALWMEVYSVKLIALAAILSVLGVGIIIVGIFRNPRHEFSVEGIVLEPGSSPRLWKDLSGICEAVGTPLPNQVIAGIDDNFFVTERDVTVEGRKLTGKTLFVSLSLLRHLRFKEAEAVLAHEMAHFSGQDTLYSSKVSPLLERFNFYLGSLHEGGITIPAYYFMLCFRALFELSLRKLSRQREFRADEIAAQLTSPRDVSGALLRIAAYSSFRAKVENEIFSTEEVLDSADVAEEIETGFPEFCESFADNPEVTEVRTTHPFDTHPPMHQRFAAVGVECSAHEIHALLKAPSDGFWFTLIDHADDLEQRQWKAFEERFRAVHEQSLPYRFLPETPQETLLVEKVFPALTFAASDGTLTIDFEKVHDTKWNDTISFSEIKNCTMTDKNELQITSDRSGKRVHSIIMKRFAKTEQPDILSAFQRYYGRYLAAVAYQEKKKAEKEQTTP